MAYCSLIRWLRGRGSALARHGPPDRRDLLNRELRHETATQRDFRYYALDEGRLYRA
jgi:hypothetical protein